MGVCRHQSSSKKVCVAHAAVACSIFRQTLWRLFFWFSLILDGVNKRKKKRKKENQRKKKKTTWTACTCVINAWCQQQRNRREAGLHFSCELKRNRTGASVFDQSGKHDGKLKSQSASSVARGESIN